MLWHYGTIDHYITVYSPTKVCWCSSYHTLVSSPYVRLRNSYEFHLWNSFLCETGIWRGPSRCLSRQTPSSCTRGPTTVKHASFLCSRLTESILATVSSCHYYSFHTNRPSNLFYFLFIFCTKLLMYIFFQFTTPWTMPHHEGIDERQWVRYVFFIYILSISLYLHMFIC
jgi:hypothetical protein